MRDYITVPGEGLEPSRAEARTILSRLRLPIPPSRQHVYNTPAMERKQKIVVIVGPTSSGKSGLAVELARKFNGEVISADSRQVYRGLNIGTGKITKREMRGVRHHLLDVASPKKVFTAQDFIDRARPVIEDVAKRGKLPIVAGGTGFYIDALVGRVELPDVRINPRLRARLEKKTAPELLLLLKKNDPRRARNVDHHNKRRLIRALEIIDKLGKVPCVKDRPWYDAAWIGLKSPARELEQKITHRLLTRIKSGLVAEAKRLRAHGLSYTRMEQLGLEYRYLALLLQHKITGSEFKSQLTNAICKYAKRQMTYWRRNKNIRWFEPGNAKSIEQATLKFLA